MGIMGRRTRARREEESLVDAMTPANEAGYRPIVGIMLLNDQWRALVGRRVGESEEAWQMPQGGIGEGETPLEAAYRELKEELGVVSAEFVAESEAWFRYDFPPDAKLGPEKAGLRGQTQKWIILRFTGEDREINLNGTDTPEFDAWRWIPVNELPETIVSFKRQVYLDLLKEFPHLAQQSLTDLIGDPIVRITMLADGVDDRELSALLQNATRDARRKKVGPD
jgi:putative (di)nucleoside polyphosphate hydrolase